MRGKRAKAYKKLMRSYETNFGFRPPFQTLLDAEIIQDAARFKMDLVGGLERTLQGQVKPMVTQCTMRHLYNAEPKDENLINQAKTYERRRCNHHELEHPLSTLECFSQVVDPKESLTNKHHYVVATQDTKVRGHMRRIPGVPLVYINRSVMILEPMATSGQVERENQEKAKFKAGLKGRRGAITGEKRKLDDDTEVIDGESDLKSQENTAPAGDSRPLKKSRVKGPKGPNPLSVKKPQKKGALPPEAKNNTTVPTKNHHEAHDQPRVPSGVTSEGANGETVAKKRKRKHKPKNGLALNDQDEAET
jgi:U3 small nucleolar RNA-associated protein 23